MPHLYAVCKAHSGVDNVHACARGVNVSKSNLQVVVVVVRGGEACRTSLPSPPPGLMLTAYEDFCVNRNLTLFWLSKRVTVARRTSGFSVIILTFLSTSPA